MKVLTTVLLFLAPFLLHAPPVHGFGFGFGGIIIRASSSRPRRRNHHHGALRSSSSSNNSNFNPNDQETPEERKARMDLVRQIQANYYSNTNDDSTSTSNGGEDGDGDGDEAQWLQTDPSDPTILNNVPLWRVQWTELPGYQNVLNVHVAHYTHMFRRLVLEHSPPWYFGHVYLHDGSVNLNNPDYFLPHYRDADETENENNNNGTSSSSLVVNDEWYAPTVGTLMKISDYTTLEDGRLCLIVQGVGRMKILEATQHVPYAVANVQLLTDTELWKPNFEVLTKSYDIKHDGDLISAIKQACKAAACCEEEKLREVEFRATLMDKTSGVIEVSPLSNVDGDVDFEYNNLQDELAIVFKKRLLDVANSLGNGDEVLLAASTLQLPQTIDVNEGGEGGSTAEKIVAEQEKSVWIELDRMIQLLETIQPGLKIPVPAQMLGLLPTNADWPPTFRLERYANMLESQDVQVGTHSKSPFVRLSKQYPHYPMIRRASRFSHVVWMLLYTVSFDNQSLDKEEVLKMAGVGDRLEGACRQLQRLNGALLSMYDE